MLNKSKEMIIFVSDYTLNYELPRSGMQELSEWYWKGDEFDPYQNLLKAFFMLYGDKEYVAIETNIKIYSTLVKNISDHGDIVNRDMIIVKDNEELPCPEIPKNDILVIGNDSFLKGLRTTDNVKLISTNKYRTDTTAGLNPTAFLEILMRVYKYDCYTVNLLPRLFNIHIDDILSVFATKLSGAYFTRAPYSMDWTDMRGLRYNSAYNLDNILSLYVKIVKDTCKFRTATGETKSDSFEELAFIFKNNLREFGFTNKFIERKASDMICAAINKIIKGNWANLGLVLSDVLVAILAMKKYNKGACAIYIKDELCLNALTRLTSNDFLHRIFPNLVAIVGIDRFNKTIAINRIGKFDVFDSPCKFLPDAELIKDFDITFDDYVKAIDKNK